MGMEWMEWKMVLPFLVLANVIANAGGWAQRARSTESVVRFLGVKRKWQYESARVFCTQRQISCSAGLFVILRCGFTKRNGNLHTISGDCGAVDPHLDYAPGEITA